MMVGREQRIADIALDEHAVKRRSAEIEHERATAIFDLLEKNRFALATKADGPFHLHLAMEHGKLVMDVRSATGARIEKIGLGLAEFRRIIKDYFLICESYNHAVRTASLSKVAAIDHGRRATHNEAGEMLRERLADRVEIDLDTARRLFTLICVLQIGR
jgi:uncharacterized protein (UPF0262 family)